MCSGNDCTMDVCVMGMTALYGCMCNGNDCTMAVCVMGTTAQWLYLLEL